MLDAYPNLLLTGKTGLYSIRLVAGRPTQILLGKQHKGLLFTEGQTFCYVVGGGGRVSGWVVRNQAGQHSLPGLEKPVVLLLEAAGKLRVQRLLKTLKLLKAHTINLDAILLETFIQWDALLAGKRYQPEWILGKLL
ncbi:hypothetical protein [Thiothrix fructosivorans]|uniref:Uncharacterized protein n=1 Tax=Thiothrix fructosivorans TaxID=111770 RepID=A0A8B0SPV1_9GAMM|nr:hypothetical protein [Thiothrix fructosivorans]MBO0611490.1 hypothetical protein [Thiothrix fructosivorans]QTX12954.1 hypothetical protein J1836_020525 [Thiothrix fructosivorans]